MSNTNNQVLNEKTALFETMPVGKALLTMAIPTIISQLITMIYNLADTFFIGMSNDPYKVAAASVVSILFFILTSLSNLFGVGGGSLMSRLMGEKRDEEAKRVGVFSIYGSLVIAIIYALICFLFTEPLARLLGASDNTITYASSYLFWVVVVGAIPSTVGMTISFLLRSAGYSKESGFGLALGGIANIILDPLFMFVILPAGNEVTGAALATLCSNIISLLYFIYIYYKLRGKTILSISPKFIRIDKSLIIDIFAIGLPSAITGMLANFSHIIRNNLTSGYGDVELAAYGIVQKVDMLPLNIGMGLCQGMMPLVAYNYASKNYERMKSFAKTAQNYGMIISGICIVIFELFASQIIWLFIKDEATIAFGTNFIRIACLVAPFIIINFQKIYCLQAMGKGKESLLLGICRQGLFAIPIIFIMNHFFQLYGVVSAQLISDGITVIFSTYIYRKVYHKLLKEKEEDSQAIQNSISNDSISYETNDNISLNDMIITIGRTYGSGGRSVGKLIANQLGISFYDSELLEQTALKSGLNKNFLGGVDEKSSLLYSYDGYVSDEYIEMEKIATDTQREIIEDIANKGPCVIVGRRADQILQDKFNLFKVFITAPMNSRIQRVMQRENLSFEESKAKIKRVDKERSDYYNSFGYHSWANASNYDLCIDTDKFGMEETAEIISEIIIRKNQ